MTLNDCQIEKLDLEHFGYRLRGPRGAQYVLIRNAHDSSLLFAVSERTMARVTIGGHEWFTDRDGSLRAAVAL